MRGQRAKSRGLVQKAFGALPWRSALCIQGLALLTLLVGGVALAHATIVFGTLSSLPEAPQPGQPFTVRMAMIDPLQLPVEDALVRLEFRLTPDAPPTEAVFAETDDPGVYEATVTLPEAGVYHLLLRDQTFRQEEAQAELEVRLGGGPLFIPGENTVVFPPTATGLANLGTWLIWIIAIPVVAGIVVTVLVLANTGKSEEPEGSAEARGENGQREEGGA
jgi:hypothetical protein